MKALDVRSVVATKGSSRVFTMPETATLSTFIKEAVDRNIGAMLITGAEGQLAGIITERDILRQCHLKVNFDTITIGQVMTRNLITVSGDDDIQVAVELMFSKKIRHLPVVTGTKVEGLITVRDLLHAMSQAHDDELKSFVAYLQGAVGGTDE